MQRRLKVLKILIVALLLVVAFTSKVSARDAFETYGDIGSVALPVAGMIMSVAQKDTEGTVQFVKAFVSTEVVTYGLKYTVNSRRPNGENHSFPSQHTSAAFAGAAFIQQRYGWEYGVPSYIAASLVGASRVTSNKHNVGDVIAGAAIGIGANLIFTQKYEKKTVKIVPIDSGALLMLNYNW